MTPENIKAEVLKFLREPSQLEKDCVGESFFAMFESENPEDAVKISKAIDLAIEKTRKATAEEIFDELDSIVTTSCGRSTDNFEVDYIDWDKLKELKKRYGAE